MARPLGSDVITILKPVSVTDVVDNSRQLTWVSPTELEVRQCSVQPFLPSDKLQFEITSERDYARATWVVFAPSTAVTRALKPHDRIKFEDRVYEVYGEVGSWRRFNGSPHHVQIILQTREG